MLAVGVALFVAPNPIALFWPWKLTTLTSQATGAWLIGIGVFALQSSLENDFSRLKAGSAGYLGFGFLQLVALLRYPNNMEWAKASAWFY